MEPMQVILVEVEDPVVEQVQVPVQMGLVPAEEAIQEGFAESLLITAIVMLVVIMNIQETAKPEADAIWIRPPKQNIAGMQKFMSRARADGGGMMWKITVSDAMVPIQTRSIMETAVPIVERTVERTVIMLQKPCITFLVKFQKAGSVERQLLR